MSFTLIEGRHFAVGYWYTYLAFKINNVSSDPRDQLHGPRGLAQVVVGKTTNGCCASPTDIWSDKGTFLVRVLEILDLNWAYDGLFAWLFEFNAKAPQP